MKTLRAISTSTAIRLYDQDGNVMALLLHTPVTSERRVQEARRLAACWNACKGLSTEALEKFGTLDRANVDRDMVLAAAQQALPVIDAYRRLSGGDGDVVAANIRSFLKG